jgi:hypothetical protein
MIAGLFDDRPSIQQRFEDFHAVHPEVYRELVRLARVAKSRGRRRYSIDALMHVVRWTFDFEHDGEFKINNDFSSRYARLIAEREPDLADFFETRKLKAS